MISLPEDYVVQKFYELGYYPKTNKYNNTYQCSCPICREGNSLGKKKRCYYIPKNDNIFCHNCGWSGKPFTWIKQVSGKTDTEIITEVEEYTGEREILPDIDVPIVKKVTETLPKDSINLSDSQQLKFYGANPIVSACLNLIKSRRLDTAVNRPDALYLSLTDPVHKNRLVLPFKNEHGDIEFYQTRTILPTDNKTRPKYVSRINAEKTLFNIDKVSNDQQCVFIFEGPINAFFTKNSVAVAGITERGNATFTERQQKQVDTTLKWLDRIWVLDSQWIDNASLKKSETLLLNGEKVFIWPEKFGTKFKDFNDICIKCKIDEISAEFIQKNTHESLEGIIKLSEIKKFRLLCS
jgi:hypothetical protein